MLVAQAGDIQHVLVHDIVLGGVEKENHVDLVVDNALPDLLDAPVLVGEEELHRQAGRLRHHTPGGVGRADRVLGEYAAVGGTELDHQVLLFGMAHNGDIHGDGTSLVCYGGLSDAHDGDLPPLQPLGNVPAGH